ncbi:MAG TPA: SDR family NAD(P)-dependent oxidoreductase [Terriglobales bacterium]|nr:SDR family NAD(P)-dependent oxidoreductase [Terriglobales bacterium]
MVSISLDGQVAVVTGGSRGIGAAVVRLLADAGAKVVFSYRSNTAAAQAVIAACPRTAEVVAVAGDAADVNSGDGLVAAACERFGRLDVAVANAGIWNADDIAIENLSPEAWRETMASNLDSVYALARAAVAQMKRQPRPDATPRGRIIAIASTAGQRGEAWHVHYGASKAGVIGLVRGLGTEVAGDGILVNCVAPGWVETDMSRPAFGTHPERVFKAIPLGRVGRPEELAGCVLFLCSPWANFMTSSVMSVNGGAVLA